MRRPVNYNNNKGIRKGGKLSDHVKPKMRRFSRVPVAAPKEVVDMLNIDLIRVLTDLGLVLKNTRQISTRLVSEGWIKTKNTIKD